MESFGYIAGLALVFFLGCVIGGITASQKTKTQQLQSEAFMKAVVPMLQLIASQTIIKNRINLLHLCDFNHDKYKAELSEVMK